MWLATCFRETNDLVRAKQFLELADVQKIQDKKFLLKFYLESAKQFERAEKYN